MIKIKILTEGGSGIGLGHVSRCKALYDQAVSQGYDVQLLVNTTDNSISMLNETNVQYVDWRDSNLIVNNIKDNHYLIVDSYLASEDVYELLVKQSAHCLILDDFNRISYPTHSTVVNISLERSKAEYNYYSGRDYIILREPFTKPIHKEINHFVRRVFITLGGAGDWIASSLTNELSNTYPQTEFYVLTNDGLAHNVDSFNSHILTKLDSSEMYDQIIQADIVVTAAGQTMFEIIRTQTPFITIQTVGNQEKNVSTLIESGICNKVNLTSSPSLINDVLKQFENLLSSETRHIFSNKIEHVIDGNGSKRIIQLLVSG